MQEKEPLTKPPEWRGAKLVRTGLSLVDTVSQLGSHVVQGKIRERREKAIVQTRDRRWIGQKRLVGMAECTADASVGGNIKECLSAQDLGGVRAAGECDALGCPSAVQTAIVSALAWSAVDAHENRKVLDV